MGGSKAYPWEASVDTPRLPPLRQDCVRQNRDQRLQQGQGTDATRRPVPIMDSESSASHASDVRNPKTKTSGPKWALRYEPWTKVDSPKIFIGPKVVHTGQAMAR